MENGFLLIERFFDESELDGIDSVLRKFHQSWLNQYESIYKNGAVNSAYITNGRFLSSDERLTLLKLVSSKKIVALAQQFLGKESFFLNTQIFFNPFNEEQKNYWHRDIQYTPTSIEDQQKKIENKETQVVHLRLALADENGIEFMPGSHFRWDTSEEEDTRLKRNGKSVFQDLPGAKKVPLKRGDLLAFDANIIHRGLYGKDRFAFDILFCKKLPEILQYMDKETLPKEDELKLLEFPEIFVF